LHAVAVQPFPSHIRRNEPKMVGARCPGGLGLHFAHKAVECLAQLDGWVGAQIGVSEVLGDGVEEMG